LISAAAAAGLHTVPPPRGPIFHVGRRPNPFYWNTPKPLNLDEPTGARFDDPDGEWATLYCATRPYGALLEKLWPLRPIPELPARYDSALEENPDPEYDMPAVITAFPADVLNTIVMGSAIINADCRFVDVDDPRNHRYLERLGGQPLLDFLEVGRIDRGSFISADRRLTRRVAGEVHEIAGRGIHGLRYSSAMDEKAECWAIWDHAAAELHGHDTEPIGDPDLAAVIQLLGFDPL
jgi:RES domain